MDLEKSIEPSVFVIIILMIIIAILYIVNLIKKKQQSNVSNCKCSAPQKTRKNIFSLYYSNGCGHSINFLPTWKDLQVKVKELNNVETSEHECSQDKDACNKNNISGVPTMILHKLNGENIEYSGDRTVASIIKFISSNI